MKPIHQWPDNRIFNFLINLANFIGRVFVTHRRFLNAAFLLTMVVTISFFSQISHSKTFRNSYVSFDLPPGWDCKLDNTAWICRYQLPKKCKNTKAKNLKSCREKVKKTKEALIILTAKEVGKSDSFANYNQHLKTPRVKKLKKGVTTKSRIIHVKSVSIGKHKWIDGMHLGSELNHYYTRYLATIKGNIAVLVTFSAHKLFYTRYSGAFFKGIKSLRVVASQSMAVNPKEISKSQPRGPIGINIDNNFALDEESLTPPSSTSNQTQMLLLAAGVLALLGLYVWLKG